LAGRALRSTPVRRARGVRVPEGAAHLRAAADRGAYRPGHHDLAAALALEPAGVEGDPRQPAGNPGRGFAGLRGAALPALGPGADPGAEARDRRLRRSAGYGADARGSPLGRVQAWRNATAGDRASGDWRAAGGGPG